VNILRDDKHNLFLKKRNEQPIPLKEDLPEVQRAVHHSHITIDKSLIHKIIEDAQNNKLQEGQPFKQTGYIVTNIRKVSGMKEFYLNPEAAAKNNDIAYITLDGRLEEINIINGLTIILPGGVPI
jgi:hypothetical protein